MKIIRIELEISRLPKIKAQLRYLALYGLMLAWITLNILAIKGII